MTDIFNINLRQMKIAKENTIFDRSNNLNVIHMGTGKETMTDICRRRRGKVSKVWKDG